MESVLVIWILAIGLVGMGLLVCVLAGFVLQRNQRSADQKLVVMVQDLVNAVLASRATSLEQADAVQRVWRHVVEPTAPTPDGPDEEPELPPEMDAELVGKM